VGRNPQIGKEYALPGGSLEPDELLEEGCRREFKEELGFDADCKGLAVSMEVRFRYKGKRFHELGYYFYVEPHRAFDEPHPLIRSIEPEMEFTWVPLRKLPEFDFVPAALAKALQKADGKSTAFLSSDESA
jgi:ADP-ribose pyrophosphatase YjhB (NUDIX family)